MASKTKSYPTEDLRWKRDVIFGVSVAGKRVTFQRKYIGGDHSIARYYEHTYTPSRQNMIRLFAAIGASRFDYNSGGATFDYSRIIVVPKEDYD